MMHGNKIILGYDKATKTTYRGMPEGAGVMGKEERDGYVAEAAATVERLTLEGILPEAKWATGSSDNWAWRETTTEEGESIRVYPTLVEFDGEEVWPGKEYGPASHVTGEIGGKFGFIAHDPAHPDRETRCVEDLADEAGKRAWKGYEEYTDSKGVHHEGPSPSSIANKKDFQSYLNLTGQSVSDRGQKVTSPLERLREKVRRHRR